MPSVHNCASNKTSRYLSSVVAYWTAHQRVKGLIPVISWDTLALIFITLDNGFILFHQHRISNVSKLGTRLGRKLNRGGSYPPLTTGRLRVIIISRGEGKREWAAKRGGSSMSCA